MDAQEAFEGTLLHELTHAIKSNTAAEGDPARVIPTDDIDSAAGGAYGTCWTTGIESEQAIAYELCRLESRGFFIPVWRQANNRERHHGVFDTQC